ncbi:MAG: hypothetical protein ACREIF_03440 [Chthoniobacterales bacterium]
MATVPPLWRDADAYVQLTSPPNQSTILLHGPLYCELARVPLWIGDRATGGAMRFSAFIKHPRLTDTGIYLLLLVQHVGFWMAAFSILSALSASVFVRVVLSLFIASQPVFYTFAHCLGSETLSMIEMALLVGLGFRMATARPTVKAQWWLFAALLLFCSIITRHINVLLIMLLPLTFLLLALTEWWRSSRTPAVANGTTPRFRSHLRSLGMSVLIGLLAVLLANGYTQLLCRKARIQSRSEFGLTFLWRLDFLRAMPSPARQNLFARVSRRVSLPDSRRFLGLLQVWIDQHETWDPAQFIVAARATLDPSGSRSSREHFDRVLNEVAAAFLYPPVRPLITTAGDDFIQSTRMTEGEIARYLFATTDYVNIHRSQLPQATSLLTFRRPSDEVMKFRRAAYFHLWDFLSFRGWCVVWSGTVALLWWLRRQGPDLPAEAVAFAATVLFAGVLMVLLNCFFAKILPRFALPMMELVLLSVSVLLGSLLSGSRAPLPAVRASD